MTQSNAPGLGYSFQNQTGGGQDFGSQPWNQGGTQQVPVPNAPNPNASPGTAYGYAGAVNQQAMQAGPNVNGSLHRIAADPNYSSYLQLGAQAQGQGAQAAQYAQSAGMAQGNQLAAEGYQAQLAMAPTTTQSAALGNLANAAQGNGPTAAGAQMQQNLDASIRAQQASANSARGNQLANAGLQAQQAGAQAQGQAAAQSAQIRANEQQAAQQAYMQAANQQAQSQTQAAANFAQTTGAQQSLGLNYYTGQQTASQEQQQMAANLATAQVNADYGLSGTQLQTQAQQNIANQQNNTAMTGATIGALGTAFAAAL